MGDDRGPLHEFEVVWVSGHSEIIRAHQVSYGGRWFSGDGHPETVEFHGEIDGRWTLVLRSLAADLRTVRNLTATERAES